MVGVRLSPPKDIRISKESYVSTRMGRGGLVALGAVAIALGGAAATAASAGGGGQQASAKPVDAATAAAAPAAAGKGTEARDAGDTAETSPSAAKATGSASADAKASASPAKRGTINDIVKPVAAGPVVRAQGGSATLRGGVVVRMVKATPTKILAVGPGETSGPGIVLQFELVNSSGAALELSSAYVTVTFAGGKDVAIPGTGSGYAPFASSVKAGARVKGVYVFRLPAAAQKQAFTASVTYAPGQPISVFTGVAK